MCWHVRAVIGQLVVFREIERPVGCDLGEARDVASNHADIVARLNELAERGRADLGDFGRVGRTQRPAGHADRPVALHLPKGR